jgi:hypothetical protein
MAAVQSAEGVEANSVKCTTYEVIQTAQLLHNLTHISDPRPPKTLTNMARCFGEQDKAVMVTNALRFATAADAVRTALHTIPTGKATI